jgi:TolA-binding protein
MKVFVTRKIPEWDQLNKPLVDAGYEVEVYANNHKISREELLDAAFGLLRMAKIFEKKDRPDDAKDIYMSIIDTYPNSKAEKMARSAMSELDL